MEFLDRALKCSDCGNDFIFTAGEQLFFFDRQFKNDPKRCKLCKAKRAGLGRSTEGAVAAAAAALPLSRTETRTECSACGIETTVPFKPTQGRPVFCRSCFQLKRVPAAVVKAASLDSPGFAVQQAVAEAEATTGMTMSASTAEVIQETPAAVFGKEQASQVMDFLAADAAQA